MLDILLAAILLLSSMVGLYCAAHTGRGTHLAVRLMLLLPALASMYTLTDMLLGRYVAYGPDVAWALSQLAIYGLVAHYVVRRSNGPPSPAPQDPDQPGQ